MIAIVAVFMQIVALGVGVYLAVIGHWGIGLLLVVASQMIHFLVEKTVHLVMRLYETRFSQDEERIGRMWSIAETFSNPDFLPSEAKKMLKDYTVIAKIGGIAYIGISIALIFLLTMWAKAN